MQYPTYMPAPYSGPVPAYGPRLDMQPYQPPQMQMPAQQAMQQPVQGLSMASRPVTSREEASGVAADFSGNLMVFPDISHNRVYVKRWNVNAGAADFIEFVPAIQPAAQQEQAQPQDAFVSLQDFQNLQDFANNLQNALETLQQEVSRLKQPTETKPAPRQAKKEKQDADS